MKTKPDPKLLREAVDLHAQGFFDDPSGFKLRRIKYLIIENAGYITERHVATYDDYWEALNGLHKLYFKEEIDELNVRICSEDENGNRSYEV